MGWGIMLEVNVASADCVKVMDLYLVAFDIHFFLKSIIQLP